MGETHSDSADLRMPPTKSNYFALDHARNNLVDVLEDLNLTSTEKRYCAHWLRMGEVEEIEVLAGLLRRALARMP